MSLFFLGWNWFAVTAYGPSRVFAVEGSVAGFEPSLANLLETSYGFAPARRRLFYFLRLIGGGVF